MPSLTSKILTKCKQLRKTSFLQGDLDSYIKYSAIIMPEELGVSIKQSAEFFKYSPSSIYRLRAEYSKEESPKKANNWGGRRKSLLSIADELDFIKGFKNEIIQGRLLNFKEIKARIEYKTGRVIHKTSIYRLLDRHGCKSLISKPR